MRKYIIVECVSADALINAVNDKMNEGYECTGGVATTKSRENFFYYAQAMLLKS